MAAWVCEQVSPAQSLNKQTTHSRHATAFSYSAARSLSWMPKEVDRNVRCWKKGCKQKKELIICFQFSHSSKPGAHTSVDLWAFST